ncbi:very short patch repair endonuclease [Chlorobaculum sp. 24CR]|uniref:AAA domain-containing protein n=1 Tax=Chlorobaculum sp. 24CR TaxID=2508878 RepID=UPI00100A5C6C|nr:AAA domain-containing protein [Chlorobaculum sp. 24CR]RXK89110.1 very short patch repair endonuclease [Chlorobaculum sp. 24CR]
MDVNSRDLLTRLLDYIEEQAKEINPRAFRLSNTREFLRHRTDLAGLPSVESDISVEGDHFWLRVHRLEAHKPPAPDEENRGFIHFSDDPDGAKPSIDDDAVTAHALSAAEGKTAEEIEALERQHRELLDEALAQYSALWEAWAESEKPRRQTIDLYGALFAIKHQLEAEETARPTELVWGMGVATWRLRWQESQSKVSRVDFEYPLLTQQMEVGIDEATMALCLRPRATDTRYEGDAFASCMGRVAVEVERAARQQIELNQERPVTPFDPGSYADLLKLVATNMDSSGAYRPSPEGDGAVPPPGEHLVVTDSWALFTRPRSNNYLLDDLQSLRTRLAEGCDIPNGPGAFVTLPSDEPVPFENISFRGLSGSAPDRGKGEIRELFFPLPYNQEQVTIVQQLEQAEGVAVQGPPGTGKTHTIANIICHYLATGRRVLVTSKGEPALAVLQGKIPEEVQPLTVAMLTGDRESLRQFENSINTIQARVSQLNPELTRQEIERCKSKIDRAHAELASIDSRIDDIAETQLAEVPVDGHPMRAQELAELVISGEAEHGWFDDEITLSPEFAPPLSDEEAGRLREARRKLGGDLAYVEANTPSADDLPQPADVAQLHGVLVRMREIERLVDEGALPALKAVTPEVLDEARQLLGAIEVVCSILKAIDELGESWAHELRRKCRQQSFEAERQALEALFGEITALTDARATFLQKPVEIPPEALGSPKVSEAVERGAQTGKPFGLIAFGNREVRDTVAKVRVAGLPPSSAEEWQHVKSFMELHLRVVSFLTRWNQFAPTLSAPVLEGGVGDLRRIEIVASTARKAHQLATQHDVTLVRRAEAVFAQAPVTLLHGTSEALAKVREHLTVHLSRADLAKAATQLSTLKAKLAGTSGPVSEKLQALVDESLGNDALAAERVAAEYAALLGELRRIKALSPELGCVSEAANRFAQAGAPKFAARIRSVPVAQTGEDAALPVNWRMAWSWARVKRYLQQIESRDELVKLSARRRDLEEGLAKLYREMVALAAWMETKLHASPRVLEALQGYATAIRRIGRGTGPNATRHRRDARRHMTSAAGAIPCWIMSHAKVSESMPADLGAFDLVIVDEASQSDIWALPAILRGKTILVVGDDKQVSPDAGFVSAERVQELRDRFLAEQPFREAMTPGSSLYDLAARVFAARQVMLREHFRCVPPIIAYSNRTFYKGAIQPLRIPKGSERIDPPLVDVHVENGVRSRDDCNREEASFIADEIAALLASERFEGRTIGVVSLLGMEQAKYIDTLVRNRCNTAELFRRRFECGDARTFQGSERDIIFLSMVVDPANCKALSGNMFEQRFNVAASRARDRMYLVRSVTASHLSAKDLRVSLLQHFDKPLIADKEEAEMLIDRCESGFEREVYSALVERGYRVIPQVKTGAYRIDMVVEGAGDARLAVECDGDEFHGPDRWPHDLARQRVLERAGWTFWRCFASTWRLHQDELLGELTERLSAMGIEPLGSIARAPKLVEKRSLIVSVYEETPR